MRHLKTTLAVLGAVTVLVLAGNTLAMAATGKGFILGKANYANKATTLKRTTNGQALKVLTRRSIDAPLVVNGRGRVTNLNADQLDGLDASALRTRSYVWRASFTDKTTVDFTLPLPTGTYLVTYSQNFSNQAFPATLQCNIRETIGGVYRLTGVESLYWTGGSYYPAVSGTGLVTKTATGQVRVHCDSNQAFSTASTVPLEIVATPTQVVSSGPISPLRTR